MMGRVIVLGCANMTAVCQSQVAGLNNIGSELEGESIKRAIERSSRSTPQPERSENDDSHVTQIELNSRKQAGCTTKYQRLRRRREAKQLRNDKVRPRRETE
jgi:hypothetical protein